MGPRFRLGFNLSRTDFPREGMPDVVRGEEQRWVVYNQYRIQTPLPYEKAKEIVGSGEIARKLGASPDEVKLIKEAYIGEEFIAPCVESGISRIYNPFLDTPEIFLEFASLGRRPEPDKGRILKFVHRYGDITMFRVHPEDKTDQTLVGTGLRCFLGTKVSEFHREARLAYSALRLYEGIVSLKEETVQEWVDHVISRWDEFGLRWDDECSLEDYHQCKQDEEASAECCTECGSMPPIENLIKATRDPFEAGSVLLVEILFKKMHPEDLNVIPVVSVQFEYRQGRSVPRFYASWLIASLLQAIWTLFYLRVTNQIQQEYRICPFCEEPIIKPRRNQVYHEGCRQAKFNQEKREVLRLWREGKSVEEIAQVTGLELDRIAKRVRKKQGGEGHQNHGDVPDT